MTFLHEYGKYDRYGIGKTQISVLALTLALGLGARPCLCLIVAVGLSLCGCLCVCMFLCLSGYLWGLEGCFFKICFVIAVFGLCETLCVAF